MKRTLASLLASLFWLSFSATSTNAYDLNDYHLLHQTVTQIRQSTVAVHVGRKFYDVDGEEHDDGSRGAGVVLCDNETEGRYLLTSEHLFPTDRRLSFYVKTKDFGVKRIKRSHRRDLALLETDNVTQPCFKGKIGEDYHVGDFVLYLGYPLGDDDQLLREGRLMMDAEGGRIFQEAHYSSGDSGGPVFAFDFGEPRLIGINQLFLTKHGQEKPWAAAVSGKQICDFLQGTVVHNDYCGGDKK